MPLFTLLLAIILSCLAAAQVTPDACTSLLKTLSLENTTVLTAERITERQTISTPGSCQSTAFVTTDACRVYAVVNTTAESAVHVEMWLPDVWFGRFLALGNGGLGGCIDYDNLDYGNTLHFATIGSDNGHDGWGGAPFLNQPEVINDFAFRAIHVEAVLGKQIANAYYNRTHDKSYYIGCSTGGRQGMQSALLYPDDFDGIVSGAPATDFNRLVGWSGMLARHLGAPNPGTSDSFIPASLWPVVSAEILNQCDRLDGLQDGIISEPDECIFDPKTLLCDTTAALKESDCFANPQVEKPRQTNEQLCGFSQQLPHYPEAGDDCSFFASTNDLNEPFEHSNVTDKNSGLQNREENQMTSYNRRDQVFLGEVNTASDRNNCLTGAQVDALTQIYAPLIGTRGELVYPRFDPGAESYDRAMGVLNGTIWNITTDWYRFVIHNDSSHSLDNFSVEDIEFADTIDPGAISTWNGNLSAFRNRGGKFLTYHGRSDSLIASGNSKRQYNLIASTLSQHSLDDFYRLFLIPGMGHCISGQSARAFGQLGVASNVVNDSAHNVLLAVVEWVEKGNAPDVIVGTTLPVDSNATQEQRVHCRYPQRSMFNGSEFVCEN